MQLIIDELVRSPGSWLSMRKATGVVMSSRVRLARNVAGVAFPGWAGEEERVHLCTRLQDVLGKMHTITAPIFLDMSALDTLERDILCERHVISHELCERGRGSAVALATEERIAVMINEEIIYGCKPWRPGCNCAPSGRSWTPWTPRSRSRWSMPFPTPRGT